MNASPAAELPLQGMRIVDMLSPEVAMSTRYLADLGAEVISVLPEPTAPVEVPSPDSLESLHAEISGANKASVVVNPSTIDGHQSLLRLLATADIWATSASADELAEWDLPGIRARLPRLVIASVTAFGLVGAYRDYRGSESVRAAMAAILCRSGVAGKQPLLPPEHIIDNAIAAQVSWALLLAYRQQRDHGIGDHLDISMLDTATQVFDPAFGAGPTAGYGRPWMEYPSGRPDAAAYYPVFACADGHVRLAVLAVPQWRALWQWLGEPAEFAGPKYDLIIHRQSAHARLAPMIERLFAGRTAMELTQEAQRRGIPVAPVLELSEVTSVSHYAERGVFTGLRLRSGEQVHVPAGYVEVDGVRAGIRRAAPSPGADTDRILGALAPIAATPPQRPDTPASGRGLPLAGLRVIDLGIIIAGAETGRMFADYGADVIKVENREHPDGSRAPFNGTVAPGFAWGNRNKRSLDVNLRTEQGAQLLAALLVDADILLSNFKPGTLDKLGFGPDRLAAINPRLVTAQSNAVGDSGPWKSWMGYGPLVRAVAGLSSLWQYPDAPGEVADGLTVYPDHVAGRIVATAALAAVLGRERSGLGAHITCAQSEIILTSLAAEIAAEALVPGSTRPANAGPHDAPSGVYPCSGHDQWCVITCTGDDEYRRLRAIVDLPDLASAAERIAYRAELDAAVSGWTASRTGEQVTARLQEAGIPAGPMRRIPEFAHDPAFHERRIFAPLYQPTVPEPVVAERRQFGSEHIADARPFPAPVEGQHTREICTERLGLTDAEVDALITAGVLSEPDPWAPVHTIDNDGEPLS